MNTPDDRQYTDHDEWVKRDGNTVTLGISDFAQSELGELVFVDLPEIDTELEAGEVACEVESVKAVAEVFAPVAGVVIEVNEALEDAADIINSDPYEGGWLMKLRIADDAEFRPLLDAAAYAAKVGG
ncbi:MAG: glycine cleavage system H protein [Myxococcota bacterium]|jgi:glycine cleavage system H protein